MLRLRAMVFETVGDGRPGDPVRPEHSSRWRTCDEPDEAAVPAGSVLGGGELLPLDGSQITAHCEPSRLRRSTRRCTASTCRCRRPQAHDTACRRGTSSRSCTHSRPASPVSLTRPAPAPGDEPPRLGPLLSPPPPRLLRDRHHHRQTPLRSAARLILATRVQRRPAPHALHHPRHIAPITHRDRIARHSGPPLDSTATHVHRIAPGTALGSSLAGTGSGGPLPRPGLTTVGASATSKVNRSACSHSSVQCESSAFL